MEFIFQFIHKNDSINYYSGTGIADIKQKYFSRFYCFV